MTIPIGEPILRALRNSSAPVITLDEAAWLVWPEERQSGLSAAMSSAQFVHLNAPVVAVQTGGRMEYFDENRQRRWSSNLPWPRANLKMARLPGRAKFLSEDASEEDSPEEDSPEEDSPAEGSAGSESQS